MTSHDGGQEMGTGSGQPFPFLDTIRAQIARMPQFGSTGAGAFQHRPDLDYFSAARIYITFKVKLAEHFPEAIPADTFDFLVDLMVHEWMRRRAGSIQAAELGIARPLPLAPHIQHALALGLVTTEPTPDQDDMQIVTLTRSARVRLNVFFDYMASYVSVL